MSHNIDDLATKIDANEAADNTYWLLWGGALVFSMQCGFCMLEVGTVRIKNTKNILVKVSIMVISLKLQLRICIMAKSEAYVTYLIRSSSM